MSSGDLTFQASVDHATVVSYVARLYAAGTTTPVVDSLGLGKPTPDGTGLITVNIAGWLNTHAAGDYEVRVAAIDGSGTNESDVSNAFTIPVPEVTVVPSFRASLFSTANATTYETSTTYTPASGSLLVAFISVSGSQLDPPTVTGHGVTWSKVTLSAQNLSTTHRLGVYVAKAGLAPTSAPFTIAGYAATQTGAAIAEYEITGVNLSGTALAAVRQAVTATGTGLTGTVTLAAPGESINRPLSFFVHLANQVTTPRALWTEGADGNYNSPATGAESQARTDAFETTASATWGTSSAWRGIALEIAASVLGGSSSLSWVAAAVLTTAVSLSGSAALGMTTTGALTSVAASARRAILTQRQSEGLFRRAPQRWGPMAGADPPPRAVLAGASAVAVTSTGALTTAIPLGGIAPIRVTATGSIPSAGTQARVIVSPDQTRGRRRPSRRWGPPPESDVIDAAALRGAVSVRITAVASLTAVSGRVVVSPRQSAGSTVIWGPPPNNFVLPDTALASATATIAFTASSTTGLTTAIRPAGGASVVFTGAAALSTSLPLASASSVVFTSTGNLTAPAGSLGGTSAVAFTGDATISTGIAAAGDGAVVFTGSAGLSTAIAAAGTSSLEFTGTGDLTTLRSVAGSSAVVFTTAGELTTGVGLFASATIVFTTTGSTDVSTAPLEEVLSGPRRIVAPKRQRDFPAEYRQRRFRSS